VSRVRPPITTMAKTIAATTTSHHPTARAARGLVARRDRMGEGGNERA
jgi:hypothetical protein